MLLHYPDIRKKSGYTEDYYKIVENLNSFITKITRILKIRVINAGLIETGYTNVDVWVESSDKQKYFIKISINDSLIAERFWYKTAYESGIHTPKPILFDFSKEIIPYLFEVVEFVEGVHLDDKFPPKDRYIGSFIAGQELRRLHTISVDGFGNIDINGKWTNVKWIDALKNFIDLRARNKLTPEIFTRKEIEKIYAHTIYDRKMEVKVPKLIHGDFGHDNILYNAKESKITFIDQGSLIGGDPIFDVAYASIPWSKELFFRAVKDGYEKEKPLTKQELYRLERLKLLCLFFAAVELYERKWDYKPFVKSTKEMLKNFT